MKRKWVWGALLSAALVVSGQSAVEACGPYASPGWNVAFKLQNDRESVSETLLNKQCRKSSPRVVYGPVLSAEEKDELLAGLLPRRCRSEPAAVRQMIAQVMRMSKAGHRSQPEPYRAALVQALQGKEATLPDGRRFGLAKVQHWERVAMYRPGQSEQDINWDSVPNKMAMPETYEIYLVTTGRD